MYRKETNIRISQSLLATLVLTGLLTAPEPARSATQWSTGEFQVEFPEHCRDGIIESLAEQLDTVLGGKRGDQREQEARSLGFRDLAHAQAYFRLIESYLADIAIQFQALGFPEPLLAQRDGKFIVEYRNLARGHPKSCEGPVETKAYHVNSFGCDSRKHAMVLNAAAWSPEGRRNRDEEINANVALNDADGGRYDNPGLYTTLAHELFHAVQGAYEKQFKSVQPCGKRDWGLGDEGIVVEAMAQAVAVTLTAEAAGRIGARENPPWGDVLRRSQDRKFLGGYPYIYNIFDPPKGAAYFLNSFWRYIADRHGGLAYLDRLLRTPVGSASPNQRDRAVWMNSVLSSDAVAGESLYTLFPAAVTEIASYGAARYSRSRVYRKWLEWVSTKGRGCQKADISDKVGAFKVDMAPYSAHCFEIVWDGFPNEVELHFEAVVSARSPATARQMADQLHLGLALRGGKGRLEDCWSWINAGGGGGGDNTCLYEKVRQGTRPSDDAGVRWWIPDVETKRDFETSGKYVLVLSNIGPLFDARTGEPRETKAIKKLAFRVGFGGVLSRDGKVRAPPQGRNMLGTGALGGTAPMDRRSFSRLVSGEPKAMFVSQGNGGPSTAGGDAGSPVGGDLSGVGLPNMYTFVMGEPGERQYIVSPVIALEDYQLGYVGPLKGEVALVDPAIDEGNVRIKKMPGTQTDPRSAYEGQMRMGPGSRWCTSGPGGIDIENGNPEGGLIGRIVRSSEDQLVIEVQTDLCQVTWKWGEERPDVTLFETVDFVMTLPFGWRYFGETAPEPVKTPGMELYAARFPYSRPVHEALPGGVSGLPLPDGISLPGFGVAPGECPCNCERMSRAIETPDAECLSAACLAQLARCKASTRTKESVVFHYEGTIGIRALMALRKSYKERGILNQNLNEREGTITVLYQPALIDKQGIEDFLRDLGVEIKRSQEI